MAHHSYRPCISKKVLFIVRCRDPPPHPTPEGINMHIQYLSLFLCGWLWVWGACSSLRTPWLAWTLADVFSLLMQGLKLPLELFFLCHFVCVLWFAGLNVSEWLKERWEMADKYLSVHVGCHLFVRWVCCPPFSPIKVLIFKILYFTLVSCCPHCLGWLDWGWVYTVKHLKTNRLYSSKSA